MCDYSLMNIPNRLAAEGEALIVHRFPTGSMGLTSPSELCPRTDVPTEVSWRSLWKAVRNFFTPEACSIPAVCIPPGTRLVLHQIPERMQRQYGLAMEEECTFDQLTASPYSYRDAVRFRNGIRVLIQELPEGQEVTVVGQVTGSEDRESVTEPDEVLIPRRA
jgi:hypothetical protein